MLDDILRHYKVIVAAGGLVQNSKGEFLFIFRNGRWDLPKGKLEPEEKIEDAALREVSEETGISKLKLRDYIVDTYHVYNLGNSTILKVSHWFNMTCKGNEPLVPQLNENITMAKWIPKEQLDEILQNTYDTIREVFRDAGIT